MCSKHIKQIVSYLRRLLSARVAQQCRLAKVDHAASESDRRLTRLMVGGLVGGVSHGRRVSLRGRSCGGGADDAGVAALAALWFRFWRLVISALTWF